jgi:hypothetical protein
MVSINHLKTPVFFALLPVTLPVKISANRGAGELTQFCFTSICEMSQNASLKLYAAASRSAERWER